MSAGTVDVPFARVLEERVRAELARDVRPPLLERIGVKTGVMLVWFYGAYGLLVFTDLPIPLAGLGAVALGLAMASTLLTVGHERLHQSRISPRTAAYWSTALVSWPTGITQAWWRAKHNVTHHGGIPDGGRAGEGALELGAFARLSPDQAWRPWHRAQIVYVPLLFPLHLLMLSISALVFSFTGRTEGHRVSDPTPRWIARQVVEAVGLPALLIGLALTRHSTGVVVGVTLLAAAVAGTALSLTLAVEVAHRGTARVPDEKAREAWARWQPQVSMTIDTPHAATVWFVGGLNFHTEHHLFPRAPMYRLRHVAPIVRATCDEFGVHYNSYRSFPATWSTFLRYLWDLGRREEVPELALA